MAAEQWDLVVVGAGPAGTAAAASALMSNPGAHVLILDRQPFPRDKPCGDGIAAEALDVLTDLGFDTDAVCDGFAPVTRLRITGPGGAVADRPLDRAVRVIPRTVFDARLLADVCARGAVYRQHTVRSVVPGQDAVMIDDRFRAPVSIGADGAESVVRRQLHGRESASRRSRTALAIRGYAAELSGRAHTQVITMTGENWPAYAWSFPIGDGRANVGYGELLVGHPLNRSQMLARMRALLPGLGEVADVKAHRLPLSPGRPPVDAGRVLLVGDALSLINPLSGEGIYYAVRSGELAGTAVSQGSDAGAAYRASLTRALGRHLRSTDLLHRVTKAPRLIDAGVKAAARRQGTFDDLVRMSLADGLFTRHLIAGVARAVLV